MTTQIGIIGIGYGQHVLLPVFQQQANVLALCASTQERAQAIAEKNNVPRAYGDWHDIIADDDIDVIAIATPPHLQPEIAITAAQAGKHLFLEKPLGATLEEAQNIAQAVEKAGVANVLDFEFPQIDAWQQARALLPHIGGLKHVEVVWNVETYANRNNLTSWKTQYGGGGTLYSFVSHVFYNLAWFTGQNIARLSATLTKAPSDPRTGDTVDMITAELESGAAASITVSSHAFMGSGHRWVFYGDDGTLILENTTRDYIYGFTLRYALRGDDAFRVVDLPAENADVDGRRLAAGRVAARLLTQISGGEAARPNVADGLQVQKLLTLAQRSHNKRKWVDAT